MKLSDIARRLGARLEPAEVAAEEVGGLAPLDRAGAGQLSYVANSKYWPLARATKAGGFPGGQRAGCPAVTR